ncbi:MAG: hypothetical protein QXQ65_04145 [Conexivisphaerales archaeon]
MAEWSGSGSPLKGPVHQVLAPGKGAVRKKGNVTKAYATYNSKRSFWIYWEPA